MTKTETIINSPTIAYISALGGIEIKKIEYGINDYVLCVSGAWSSKKTTHRVMIKYNHKGEAFFILYGCRYYLSEAIRV